MNKKVLILANILIILSLIFVYTFLTKNPPENTQNEITIFTREPLLGIHAKMITASDENIYIAKSGKLSKNDIDEFNTSSIILSSKPISESDMGRELQSYKWLYITIPSDTSKTKTHSAEALSAQIELVRDTLSDVNPSLRWFYYDNAGNYIHLINTTLASFKTRIEKLKPTNFVTIGDNLNNFLQGIGIANYRVKNYENLSSFLLDRDTPELIKEKSVNYIFATNTPDEGEVKKIRKKYPDITVYLTPDLEDDTSRWGYIRFSEKMMNDFVAAFDTYD